MNYYLMATSVDWADEFNVYFGDLIDEDTYAKYVYLQKTIKTIKEDFSFGTNEYFENFEYLNFYFVGIPEYEAQILLKYDLPMGESIISRLFEYLEENLVLYADEEDLRTTVINKRTFKHLKYSIDDMSFETFVKLVDRFSKALNNE